MIVMDFDLKAEDLLMQLRDKLNSDQVKLWLPPYYVEESGSCEAEMKQLSARYSPAVNTDNDRCLKALIQLQTNACERLKEREHFQNTGIATVKVRLPGDTRATPLPIRLSSLVSELQELVATTAGVGTERIKLIWNGQVLQGEAQLSCVGLQNGSQVMALLIHNDPQDLKDVESRYRFLQSTKEDAQLLAGSRNTSGQYLQIADQTGKTLELPPAERRALLVAMSLHEKGRAAMKDSEHALALVLYLEADREFNQCRSKLLDSVDNYALLNLDIAWCYMCLRSVTQLPEAEKRLKLCEERFHRSYGPNLERLMAIKGTTGNEAALFLRLHLLQAIVLFHQNKRQEAAKLFQRAENELLRLKVSDTSLASLLELGYTASEARLSLRATNGDVNAAAMRITRLRQEKIDVEEGEREKQRLGRCKDDTQWVDARLHRQLMGVGFTSLEAKLALCKGNNDFELSLQLLQDKEKLMKSARRNFHVLPEWVQQVVSVGFDHRMASAALRKHFGDIEKAVEELVAKGGVIEGMYCDGIDNGPSVSGTQASTSGSQSQQQTRGSHHSKQLTSGSHESQQQEQRKAYKRLAEGIATSENDHLDLTLTQEEEFLRQYQALL